MSRVAPAKPYENAQGSGVESAPRATVGVPENRAIAAKLEEYASLLEQQQANPFRVKAYERAAQVVAGLDRSVAEIHRDAPQFARTFELAVSAARLNASSTAW